MHNGAHQSPGSLAGKLGEKTGLKRALVPNKSGKQSWLNGGKRATLSHPRLLISTRSTHTPPRPQLFAINQICQKKFFAPFELLTHGAARSRDFVATVFIHSFLPNSFCPSLCLFSVFYCGSFNLICLFLFSPLRLYLLFYLDLNLFFSVYVSLSVFLFLCVSLSVSVCLSCLSVRVYFYAVFVRCWPLNECKGGIYTPLSGLWHVSNITGGPF